MPSPDHQRHRSHPGRTAPRTGVRHRRRRLGTALLAVAVAAAAVGCAGRLGRNDTDPYPGEPSPARGNVPPDEGG